MFNYIEFARYRYDNRGMRWKGHEPNMDETLDSSIQSLDQLCFSSQFYFFNALYGSSMVLLLMGATIMLREEYNVFADPLFPLITAFIIFSGLTWDQVPPTHTHTHPSNHQTHTHTQRETHKARRTPV